MIQFVERLHKEYTQLFTVERVIYRERTEHQDLVIFENAVFGRVLALDGVVQTTERDNHVYHEMLAHVPILAHGKAGEVLIIGGGDGGTLREVVKHDIARATLVEIDPGVIELSRKYLPALSDGAFDNARTDVAIADGFAYVRDTDRRFDVIIVDSTDPIGPGAVLFTSEFYQACKRCLTEGGVLVTQNGVPLMQPDEVATSHHRLGALFADTSFFLAYVPSYIGGAMTCGWASDDPGLRRLTEADLAPRYERAGLSTRYYSPAVHVAAFALPPELQALIADA
jgi:spermidine synthase